MNFRGASFGLLTAAALAGAAGFVAPAFAVEEPRGPYAEALLEALAEAEGCALTNQGVGRALRGQGLAERRRADNAVFSLVRKGEATLDFSVRPDRVVLIGEGCPVVAPLALEQGGAAALGEVTALLEANDCVIDERAPAIMAIIERAPEDFKAAAGSLMADGRLTRIAGHGQNRVVYRAGELCADLNPADTREEEIRRLDADEEGFNALRQSLLARAESGDCAISAEDFAKAAGQADGAWTEEVETALLGMAVSGDAGRKTEAAKSSIVLNIGALCR